MPETEAQPAQEVEALRWLEQTEAVAQANTARPEWLERELAAAGLASYGERSSVTAASFGIGPLRKVVPEVFEEISQRYGSLMEIAVQWRIFKGNNHNISDQLRSVAEDLGLLRGGPRDVVELHSAVMREKANAANPEKSEVYMEEGRLMELELMGHLVSHYRGQAVDVRVEGRERGQA